MLSSPSSPSITTRIFSSAVNRRRGSSPVGICRGGVPGVSGSGGQSGHPKPRGRHPRPELQVAGTNSDLDWLGRMVGEFRGLTDKRRNAETVRSDTCRRGSRERPPRPHRVRPASVPFDRRSGVGDTIKREDGDYEEQVVHRR